MIRVILFDFDGVILDSIPVRDQGFEVIFEEHGREKVDALLAYHHHNGGLSRYVKIRYFYEELLGQPISEEEVKRLAERFSEVMRARLTDKSLLIGDAVAFIEAHSGSTPMHIVSGSDGEELRWLCGQLGVDGHFLSIHGSPTPKTKLVADLLEKHAYPSAETILIGDSVNDLHAAADNGVAFYGYNNASLKGIEGAAGYIDSLRDFKIENA